MIEIIKEKILLKKFNSNAVNRKWWINNGKEEDFDKLLLISDNIQEAIYLTMFPYIETNCKCDNKCDNKLKFISYTKGYSLYCDKNCLLKKQDIQKKREQTNLLKYGVSNVSQADSTKQKISNSNKISMNNSSTQQKRKDTLLAKYGDENYNNREQCHNTKVTNNSYTHQKETYKETLKKKEVNHINQHLWSDKQKLLLSEESLKNLHLTKSLLYISKLCNVNKNTISSLFKKYNIDIIIHKTSGQQQEINLFLSELNIDYEMNNRSFLEGKELDFLFNNFAIEYNGLYYHSNIKPNYHLSKTIACENKNIQLFHIFENEWIGKKEIWKSMILSKLNLTYRVAGRKCEIKEVCNIESKKFLDNNHMQGNISSSIRYGLYYNSELYSIMTFGKSRYNNIDYELYRFCNKLNCTVIGGASKLLAHFEKLIKPKSLVTYANRRWSTGHLYKTIGFDYVDSTSPNFFYFKSDYILHSRLKFQKHKLKNMEYFEDSLSAKEIMMLNNYRCIYDSGNLKYIKEYNEKPK